MGLEVAAAAFPKLQGASASTSKVYRFFNVLVPLERWGP